MNLEEEYLDVLQNIESAITAAYRQNPALRDPEVIKGLDAATKFYQRKKKKFTELPVTLTGNSLEIYDSILAACEMRRQRGPDEEVDGNDGFGGLGQNIPIVVLIRCLEKVLKSANRWFKLNGQRGYLNFVSQFIP